MTQKPKCDFCSAPAAPWVYTAEEFDAYIARQSGSVLVGRSDGAWSACDHCKRLIDAGKWDELALHSFEALLYEHPEFQSLSKGKRQMVLNGVRTIHNGFQLHHDGRAPFNISSTWKEGE